MVNTTHEVILCFLHCLNEIYTILYIASIANTYQLLFPMELKAVNENIIRTKEYSFLNKNDKNK